MNEQSALEKSLTRRGVATYPAGHKPGMAVPKGGSSCQSCEYYQGKMICTNRYFIRWNGSNRIPANEPDEYCSDWYERR
jgi:hypothetical protein